MKQQVKIKIVTLFSPRTSEADRLKIRVPNMKSTWTNYDRWSIGAKKAHVKMWAGIANENIDFAMNTGWQTQGFFGPVPAPYEYFEYLDLVDALNFPSTKRQTLFQQIVKNSPKTFQIDLGSYITTSGFPVTPQRGGIIRYMETVRAMQVAKAHNVEIYPDLLLKMSSADFKKLLDTQFNLITKLQDIINKTNEIKKISVGPNPSGGSLTYYVGSQELSIHIKSVDDIAVYVDELLKNKFEQVKNIRRVQK